MSDCKYEQFLGAYHDDELDLQMHEDVHQHLQTCCLCRDQLAQLRRLSGLIRNQAEAKFANQALQPQELRRIHAAVKHAGPDQPLLRIAGFMSAVAASVLIISAAWLVEIHGSPAPNPLVVSPLSSPSHEWQEVAILEYQPPLVAPAGENNPGAPMYAQADNSQFVNWMVNNLSK